MRWALGITGGGGRSEEDGKRGHCNLPRVHGTCFRLLVERGRAETRGLRRRRSSRRRGAGTSAERGARLVTRFVRAPVGGCEWREKVGRTVEGRRGALAALAACVGLACAAVPMWRDGATRRPVGRARRAGGEGPSEASHMPGPLGGHHNLSGRGSRPILADCTKLRPLPPQPLPFLVHSTSSLPLGSVTTAPSPRLAGCFDELPMRPPSQTAPADTVPVRSSPNGSSSSFRITFGCRLAFCPAPDGRDRQP